MRFRRSLLSVCLLALLSGCHTASVDRSVAAQFGGSDPDQQIEFWHTLATKSVTCNDDAFHGLLLYVDGEDKANDYAARVTLLKSRGLIAGNFDRPATRAIDRGTLATAITKSLSIKGGMMMRLSGASPRYAVRELMYAGLYPPSSPNQTFSGAEFLGVMGKMEDWQRANSANVSPVMPNDLPAGSTKGGGE